MDSRSDNKAPTKGGIIPLSEHPDMNRLADILKRLPTDRQEAFMDWNNQEVTQGRGSGLTLTVINQDRGEITNGQAD